MRTPQHYGEQKQKRKDKPKVLNILVGTIACVVILFLVIVFLSLTKWHGNTDISPVSSSLEVSSTLTTLVDMVDKLEREHEELHSLLAAFESGAISHDSPAVVQILMEQEKIAAVASSQLGKETTHLRIVNSSPVTSKQSTQAPKTPNPSPAPTLSPKSSITRRFSPVSPPPPPPSPPTQSQSTKSSVSNVPTLAPGQGVPFPPTIMYSSMTTQSQDRGKPNNQINSQPPSMLVVGGTDGSGTRRVVQILTLLGVTMVSEDPETYDIHGDAVGGWPTVVAPVIRMTRSLNYDPTKFNPLSFNGISKKLQVIIDLAKRDSTKPTSFTLAVGGALAKPKNTSAPLISYGFKAPVAMTMAPMFAHLVPHFKFLHVVRDGRDIAFSANQGPVEKFYTSMYGEGEEHRHLPPVKAIRLWSDWNSQIHDWAKNYATSIQGGDANKSFSYMTLHAEDLVSDSADVRFAAISTLAEWVGSSLSDRQVCCLAVKGASFMGSHDRTPRRGGAGGGGGAGGKTDTTVTSRYGKWKSRLQREKGLSDQIHAMGGSGLKLFGYEPLRQLADSSAVSRGGFHCNLSEEDCGVHADESTYAQYGIENVCSVSAGKDYKGGDLISFSIIGESPNTCCTRCKLHPGCKYYTIDIQKNICYLKQSKGSVETDLMNRLVSGDVL